MEHGDNQETPCFLPVIARLDRLDRLLVEEKRSISKTDRACVAESKNECKTLSSALEEVHHKGTLMERLALLEKRVLELSLEINEGNTTSRSSSTSSTLQGSEMVGENDSELKHKSENGDAINKQQMRDPSTIQAQEKASPADEVVKERAARSRRQKTKSQKKWPWLFRHPC
ncbi:uncharacterized protein LOC130988221 isoform X2 [Salvia miltiorrhiza]|uniref:uncharacterized protein LOC130988221 isoform X2 n=1 Tax=Salvia miltiorrhiza TaxID=226208 RepID=UPI0025AB8CCD|nr:uncharacterized protein LOC130988221 isoform X2 [Salvia miltiorrhiza]